MLQRRRGRLLYGQSSGCSEFIRLVYHRWESDGVDGVDSIDKNLGSASASPGWNETLNHIAGYMRQKRQPQTLKRTRFPNNPTGR